MSKSDYIPDEKDSKVERSSIIKNVRKILDNYHVLLYLITGGSIGYLIDRVFVPDVFYNNPILRPMIMPIIFMSLLIVFYIGFTNNFKLIRFLELLFLGNMTFFVGKAFSIILLFIDDYIINYSTYHTFTYIVPYWLVFSIVRSLGLTGLFALLDKMVSLGKKAYPEEPVSGNPENRGA